MSLSPKSKFWYPRLEKVALQKLKDNATTKTKFHDFSGENLPELELETIEHPRLKTLDFYGSKGKYRKCQDYVLYQDEKQHASGESNLVTLDKILKKFNKGQISFVGQAGCGKTTLLKSLTQEIIAGKYDTFKDIANGMVHFVHLRQFNREKSISPIELLFSDVSPEMSKEEMNAAWQYAKRCPEKVLFIIDSLDTVSYTVDGVYTGIKFEERSSPESILYHLLAGNLLPGCHIITSSREYAIRNYKGNVQANEIIALSGFTEESKRKIVVGYYGKETGEKILLKLELRPVINSLCSNPLWLILTLIAFKPETGIDPSTMSGVMITALQSMTRSKHAYEKIDIEMVDQLARMAFTGTEQNRVEFSSNELPDFGLNLPKVRDLMIATPTGAYQRVILGDTVLMFTHQSLQEMFTAFHIAKMLKERFEEFIPEKIRRDHYAVVRRFLNGILLNAEVCEGAKDFLGEIEDFKDKQMFLKNSLSIELGKRTGLFEERRIELFTSLNEGGDGVADIIRNKVTEFEFSGVTVSPSQMYSIGWIMGRQAFIQRLNLSRCGLDPPSLSALHHALIGSGVQLDELDVSENTFEPDSLEAAAKICKHCKANRLMLRQCQFQSGALQSLSVHSLGCKLDELDVSENAFEADSMETLAKICKQCKTNRLVLKRCQFKSRALQSFLVHSPVCKVDELGAFQTSFGPNSMEALAKICKQCKTNVLMLTECRFKRGALQSFLEHSLGHKFLTLGIGDLHKLCDDDRISLSRTIKQCGVEDLLFSRVVDLRRIAVESFETADYKVNKILRDGYRWSVELTYTDELQNYFPLIAEELNLTASPFSSGLKRRLQAALDAQQTKQHLASPKTDEQW